MWEKKRCYIRGENMESGVESKGEGKRGDGMGQGVPIIWKSLRQSCIQ